MTDEAFDDFGDGLSRLGNYLIADRERAVEELLSGELPNFEAYLASCAIVRHIDDTIRAIGQIQRGQDVKKPPERQSVNVEEC